MKRSSMSEPFLLSELFFSVAPSGVLRAAHFLMVKVIHDDRMPRLCPSVWQFVVYKEAVVFFCQLFCLFLQCMKIATVALVIDCVIQRIKISVFLLNII